VVNLVKVNVWLKDINNLPARMTSTTEFIDSECLIMIKGTAY